MTDVQLVSMFFDELEALKVIMQNPFNVYLSKYELSLVIETGYLFVHMWRLATHWQLGQ